MSVEVTTEIVSRPGRKRNPAIDRAIEQALWELTVGLTENVRERASAIMDRELSWNTVKKRLEELTERNAVDKQIQSHKEREIAVYVWARRPRDTS